MLQLDKPVGGSSATRNYRQITLQVRFWLRVWPIAIALTIFGRGAIAADSQTAPQTPAAFTETLRHAHFEEPLIATSARTQEDDDALVGALSQYEQRKLPEDMVALGTFLSDNPHSAWASALYTNKGLSDLHYGYYSRAIEDWKKAWAAGKSAQQPQARALVDRAVGELAHLYASLGQNKELAALFVEIGRRPVSGSATEFIQNAREELTLAKKDPRHLYICGPLALLAVMRAEGATPKQVDFLHWYHAPPTGTNLAEIGRLADKGKFAHDIVFRKQGERIPVPSVVHWKLGHYAAIVGKDNGRYHVRDTIFSSREVWMSEAAIDAEASGYFLIDHATSSRIGLRLVGSKEASGIWGRGPTCCNPAGTPGPQDPKAKPGQRPFLPPIPGPPKPFIPELPIDWDCGGSGVGVGMCNYNIGESTVSLALSDIPVGYSPPIGPSAKVQLFYNQREDSQPANFSFFNVSPKWTMNWLSYITDDPNNIGTNVSRYIAGGGAYYYTGYQSSSGQFATQVTDSSILVLTSQSPVTYQRQMPDGSVEVYAQSDGATSYPRNIFLSKVIDPQGNALTLTYDAQQRLISLTDAAGRQTSFAYGLSSNPLLVTAITDPFGRSATLTYDASGRLSSITDTIGITSSFTYDANSLVNSLTTPYGTTAFSYTSPSTSGPPRFVQVTDPMGFSEREEWVEPASVPGSDPSSTVPTGMPLTPANEFLNYRDSFYWSKAAYVAAGCTPSGGCDYSKARDRHFAHYVDDTNDKSTTIESVKYPLEHRIWLNYSGQTESLWSGTNTQPTAIGRVLDDGSTQISKAAYDSAGYYKITQFIDPVGRTTSYTYSNHIDLSTVTQAVAGGTQQTIAQYTYNSQHRPTYLTDAAGQTTGYTYNVAGQLTTVTNALSQTTTYQYNGTGDLVDIINANSATAASLAYDSYDRIRTLTDSEGYALTLDYDAADRITKVTYPDGSTDTYTYSKLDLASYTDRTGRVWSYAHDADRRLTGVTDPMGAKVQLGYNQDGQLTSLIDPKSNETQWAFDVEGRLISKTFSDSSVVTYTYESSTNRLKSILDALGQTKQYTYSSDNRLTGISYVNAVNSTPSVTFAYDPYFPRLASMTDGTGTTQFSYVPVGSLGALRMEEQSGPLADSTVEFTYDAIGRVATRTVQGSGAESFGYDAIGRLDSDTSDLGQFSLGYLGQTGQVSSRSLASSTLATTWSYQPNAQDRRLAEIDNVGLSSGQYSNYAFTSTPYTITNTTETSDTAGVYPPTLVQTASYNNLNQLTNLSGQSLSFDANGNLLSDGQRSYSWDAENRLIAITYPSQAGKQTAFAYNGLGQRVSISSTPAGGGSTVTNSYIWCGTAPCQARSSTNSPTREYFAEGEFVPGSPGQPYYYGIDQIGSVRRVFASTSNAPAYGYDPYGNALQSSTPLTDVGYAGMFYNADSGLNLTLLRTYDPVVGRWISRDPFGEATDPAANLYAYVLENPTEFVDPSGGQCVPPPPTPAQPPNPPCRPHPFQNAAIVGSAAYVGLEAPELVNVAMAISQGVSVAEAVSEMGPYAAAGGFLVGLGTYAADRYTNGAISNFMAEKLGICED